MHRMTKHGMSEVSLIIAMSYSVTCTLLILSIFGFESRTAEAASASVITNAVVTTSAASVQKTPVKAVSIAIPTVEITPSPTPSPTPTPTPTPTPETPEEWYDLALANADVNPAQDSCLTRSGGVYQGPSGRETYYNLNMDLVVQYMRDLGYSEEEYPYWVREDGCKMLGNYIIVAANFSIRPKGTILETSLGTAIVCDTGSFVSSYPEGIDIAVDW